MNALLAELFIPGRPRTKGSLKAIMPRGSRRPVLVEDHAHSKPWRMLVKRTQWQQMPHLRLADPYAGPVRVELGFYFAQTGPAAQRLNWPTLNAGVNANGDLDKLERNVLDALQDARLLADDCLVVGMSSFKAWALAQAGLSLRVEAL